MNDSTKIHLSERELEMVNDSQWILTKHIIIQKVFELFGTVLNEMKLVLINGFYITHKNNFTNGKISRGENYIGLPYVILDYPNIFNKTNAFAIRSLFWWGNFFSITLHIKGIYKKNITGKQDLLLEYLKMNDFWICINDDEWQHHYNQDNYIKSNEITDELLHHISQKDFIKISKRISFDQWSNAHEFFMENFNALLRCPLINYPNGETDLLPVLPKDGSGL